MTPIAVSWEILGAFKTALVTGIPATNYHMYYHMYYHLIAGTIATNYNRQGTLYRVTTEGSKIIHQARESFYDYSGFLGLSYTIRQ